MENNRILVACRHRAAGSPDIYFGPFESAEDLQRFCQDHGLTVAVIELVDPRSPESEWWI